MTNVIQVTNVSPSTTSEQMRTLFGFLGNIEELKLFPPDESPLPVTSRVCFVKFLETESVGVSQHLTNTVFVDRALIVVPFAEGVIPDESKALSLLAPANAVAGCMPGGGLLPTPNHLTSMGGVPLSALGNPNMDPMVAMGMSGNMNPQALSADFLKLMQSMDPTKMNPMAAGMMVNHGMKNDSNKEIEAAMKRVREAQSLISAAIEPGNKKDDKRKHSRSSSRSRRRRSRSRSRHRRSKSRSRRRSHSRSWRRSKSPRRRKSHSRERGRRSKSRDKKKEEKSKKRSKTPPKSYSSTRRSRSISRRRRRSRSASRSPKKSRSPKRKLSRSPSPRRHKKDKKKDKEREKDRDRERKEVRDRSRDERERSTSKKKSKDQEKDHDRKSDSEKGDVKSSLLLQVTRDYDEEEQGYDSGKEVEEEERKSNSDSVSSPKPREESEKKPVEESGKKSKQNGDDHHDEDDMEMSD
ncbi:serine/arginine-rich splicing factor 11 isoform X1 [Salmo salar]|uniref:Serine/arginine-rich splicing factor 11 isoform X1 n=2 Tax=Salmo salar TaxID=8030 RepID=A0A1S3MNJ3_SALSA|nr:serine/arginine-rich splicing factor 11 isoform X1 [Salmo salar]|eukprot:XP_014004747.1 PREDICTED: serine/arginine-rich splicing factor 11-like [Salmo salar]